MSKRVGRVIAIPVRRLTVFIAVIVALVALHAPEAQAADTECRGTFVGVVVGKLVVPDGEVCVLNGTIVPESIIVGVKSKLIANQIEVLTPGTVSIQANGADSIEVTGLCKSCIEPGADPEVERPREVLGSLQAVGGGKVIIADTIFGGALQILDNSDEVRITESFVEGAVQLAKNKGGVSVMGNFLGEGVEISETEGDIILMIQGSQHPATVAFIGNISEESDLTISKTKGNVVVKDNPSLGENFEVSETSGHVMVVGNTINDNAEIFANLKGAIVSGNRVGDNLALAKIEIDPLTGKIEFVGSDPVTGLSFGTIGGDLKILDNIVGDNVVVLEAGGEVTFAFNVVEGAAAIDKTTGRVTANNNWIGFQPPEPPEPGGEPEVSEVASGGSFLVSEASEGAIVRDNNVTGNLDVTENGFATPTTPGGPTSVSNNMVRNGITVSKNRKGTEVSLNRAGGDIECKDNDPPATGAGNMAGFNNPGGSGTLRGECAEPATISIK
jgi:hypothetical protein